MTRAKISIILPTLNEEEAIGRVIDEIPRAALEEAGYAIQVLVVDGNSVVLSQVIKRLLKTLVVRHYKSAYDL